MVAGRTRAATDDRIFREEVKQGKGAAHEKVEMGYVRALSKAKAPHASYASIEEAIKLSDTQPLKAELAQLDAQDGELRVGSRTLIATWNRNLSYPGTGQPRGKLHYATVQITRVRPGHNQDYQETRRLLNEAWTKMKSDQPRAVYNVSSGMPTGTFLVFTLRPSLASLDPPATPGMTVPQAIGDATAARYQKLVADSVIGTESLLFAVNPRMSYPPKDIVEADKEFWAPKPAPAKPPAAKPTSGQ